MKKKIKIFLGILVYPLLRIFGGKAFYNPRFDRLILFRYFWMQKVLRRNAHVPWPFHPSSQAKAVHKIDRGDRNPGMSIGCYLDGRNGIKFGKNVWVGPRVSVVSMNHEADDYNKYVEAPPIEIGDNCWLATNAVILPGVKLGNHVIVGAGAVVTKSFEDDDILIGGNPAKMIKKIPPYKEKKQA